MLKIRSDQAFNAVLPGDPLSLGTEQACADLVDTKGFCHTSDCISFRQALKQYHSTRDDSLRGMLSEQVGSFRTVPCAYSYFDINSYTTHGYLSDLKKKYAPLSRFSRDDPLEAPETFPQSLYESPQVSSCSCSLESARRYRLTGTILTYSQLQVYMRRLMQVTLVNMDYVTHYARTMVSDVDANFSERLNNTSTHEVGGLEEQTPLNYSHGSVTSSAGANIPLYDHNTDDTICLTQWLQIAQGWKLTYPIARLMWERFVYSHPCIYPYKDTNLNQFKVNLSEFLQFLQLQAQSPYAPAIYSHSVDLTSLTSMKTGYELLKELKAMKQPLSIESSQESFQAHMKQFQAVYTDSKLNSDKMDELRGYLSMRSRLQGSTESRFVASQIHSFLLLCLPSHSRRLFTPHQTISAHNQATLALVKRTTLLHTFWEASVTPSLAKTTSPQFQKYGRSTQSHILSAMYTKEIASSPQRVRLHGMMVQLFKNNLELQSMFKTGENGMQMSSMYGWGGSGASAQQGHLLHQIQRVIGASSTKSSKDTVLPRGQGYMKKRAKFVENLISVLKPCSKDSGQVPFVISLPLPISIHSLPAMSSVMEPHQLCALGYICDIAQIGSSATGLHVDNALSGVVSNVVSVGSTLSSIPSHEGVQEDQSNYSFIASGQGQSAADAPGKLQGSSVLRAMNTTWITADQHVTVAHLCPDFAFNTPPSASVFAVSSWLQSQLQSYYRGMDSFSMLFPADTRASMISALSKVTNVVTPSQQLLTSYGHISGFEHVPLVEGYCLEVVPVGEATHNHALANTAVLTLRAPDTLVSPASLTYTHNVLPKQVQSWISKVRSPMVSPHATPHTAEMVKIHHACVATLAQAYISKITSATTNTMTAPPAPIPEVSQCLQSILNVQLSPNPVQPEIQLNELLSIQKQKLSLHHQILPVYVAVISPYLARVTAVALALHIKGMVSLHTVYRLLKAAILVILKENKAKMKNATLDTYEVQLVKDKEVVTGVRQTVQNTSVTLLENIEVGRDAFMSAPHPHVSDTSLFTGDVPTETFQSSLRHDQFLSSQFARKSRVLPSSSVMPALLLHFVAASPVSRVSASETVVGTCVGVLSAARGISSFHEEDLEILPNSSEAPPQTTRGWVQGLHPYMGDSTIASVYHVTSNPTKFDIVLPFTSTKVVPLQPNATKYTSRYLRSSLASNPTASTLIGVMYCGTNLPIVCKMLANTTIHIPRPPVHPVSPILTPPPPHIPPIQHLHERSVNTPVPIQQVVPPQVETAVPPTVHISHCYNTTITALWPASTVLIDNCSGVIYLGAVGAVVLTNCYNLELHVTAHTLTIRGCVGISVHTFTTTSPIIHASAYVSLHARTSVYASQYLDSAIIGIHQQSITRKKQPWGILAALRRHQQTASQDASGQSSATLVLGPPSQQVEDIPEAFPAAVVQPIQTPWMTTQHTIIPSNYNLYNQAVIPTVYTPPGSFLAAVAAAHYTLVGAKVSAVGLSFPGKQRQFGTYRALLPYACHQSLTPRLQDITHAHIALADALQLQGTVANVTGTVCDPQKVDYQHIAGETKFDKNTRYSTLRPFPYLPSSLQQPCNPQKVPLEPNPLWNTNMPALTLQLATHAPKPLVVEETSDPVCMCHSGFCTNCQYDKSYESLFFSELIQNEIMPITRTVPSTEYQYNPSSIDPSLSFTMTKDGVIPIGIVGAAKTKTRILAPLVETIAYLRPLHASEHIKLRTFVHECIQQSPEAKHAMQEVQKNLHLYIKVRSLQHQLVHLRGKQQSSLGISIQQSSVWTSILATANTVVSKVQGRIASQQGVKNTLEQLQCVALLPCVLESDAVKLDRRHIRHIRLAERLQEIVMSTVPLNISHINDLRHAPFFPPPGKLGSIDIATEEEIENLSTSTPFVYCTTTYAPCPVAQTYINQQLHLASMQDQPQEPHICTQQCIFGSKRVNLGFIANNNHQNMQENPIADVPHADALRGQHALEDMRSIFRVIKNTPQNKKETVIDTILQKFKTWLEQKDKQVSVSVATNMLEALLKN